MRRYRRGRERRENFEGINITPFTDILLVLLIIFMIAGSSLAPTGLGVDRLAKTSTATGASSDARSRLMVEIDRRGEVHFLFRDQALSWESVAKLQRSTPLTLAAHPRTPSGTVVGSYDKLLRMGFSDIEWGPPTE